MRKEKKKIGQEKESEESRKSKERESKIVIRDKVERKSEMKQSREK